jgi:hypothetical protein
MQEESGLISEFFPSQLLLNYPVATKSTDPGVEPNDDLIGGDDPTAGLGITPIHRRAIRRISI